MSGPLCWELKSLFYKEYFFSEWTSDQLNISSTFFSLKLDSPSLMFWLEENLSNVLITGESSFDEKNVEEMFN